MSIDRWTLGCACAVTALLAGCAAKPVTLAMAPAPVVVLPPAPMPQPPAGATAGMAIPVRLADGSYATPNRSLTPAATLWHVRVALNVAALGCRGASGDTIVAGYNALLKTDKALLTKANRALMTQYAAGQKSGGEAAYDDAMTRLYNYFAQPGAQDDFCAAAASVVSDLATLPPAGDDAAAASALAKLDVPFVAFYSRYDAYRTELASWQADRLRGALQPVDERPRMAMAVSAPVAVGTQPPPPAPHLSIDPSVFGPR